MDERLQEILGRCYSSLQPVKGAQQVRRGGLYIAPFAEVGEEPCYYRARVNAIMGNKVTVFFIDYGNMETMEVQSLLVISRRLIEEHPDILRIPGLAMECRLAKLQPSRILNSKGLWDSKAVVKFKELMEEGSIQGNLVGSIFSVTKSGSSHSKFVISFDSINVLGRVEKIEVRTELLRMMVAEAAPESYLSQKDNEERRNFRAYHEAMQNYLKYRPNKQLPQPEKGETRMLNIRVPLNGPFSPLEHKVLSMTRNGSTKMAHIDVESVNSVMLNQSPCEPFEHYLVAAHVGMNPSGETLQVRNSSWLPARPGLGAFATMMFSPQVELRTNRTRITGCISGMGPKTYWEKRIENVTKEEKTRPFYTEHDIETKFDVNVTNDDIDNINRIRFWMNYMLSKSEPDQILHLTQPIKLDKAQKGIKSALENLMDVERVLEEKESIEQSYRWNILSPALRLRGSLTKEEHIFKMIDGVRIDDKKDELQLVIKKLTELWKKQEQGNTRPMEAPEYCPACPSKVALNSLDELHLHLHSRQHKEAENQLLVEDK